MQTEIKRDYYLEQLIRRKHNRLIKVVTGIRRCGKSYLLRTLFKNHLIESGVEQDHIIEMAFDLYDNIEYRDPKVFYDDFIGTAREVMTSRHREGLRHLINLKFKKHSRYNLPNSRLKVIEKLIRKRAQLLLEK